jgi:hypothetical protein
MIEAKYGTVEQEPDQIGVGGKAWRIPMAPVGQRGRPDSDGTVVGWLLHAPSAHPFWTYWMVAVIHLRPIDGVRPAVIRLDGATHEIMIAALDPGCPLPNLNAVGRCEAAFTFLVPIDLVEQFIVRDDAQAAQLGDLAVSGCVEGYASPDQDWRAWWRGAVRQTASHLREGRHAEPRA